MKTFLGLVSQIKAAWGAGGLKASVREPVNIPKAKVDLEVWAEGACS